MDKPRWKIVVEMMVYGLFVIVGILWFISSLDKWNVDKTNFWYLLEAGIAIIVFGVNIDSFIKNWNAL